MKYWLIKSEPELYSWETFVRDGSAMWEGVRSYQARNNLQAMEKGDLVLFYHSQEGREVTGIATVSQTAYQDPTTDDERWVVVDFTPVRALHKRVSLNTIRADERLSTIGLIRQSRLSVMPLQAEEFMAILELGETPRETVPE